MVMIRILSDFFERFPSYETGFRQIWERTSDIVKNWLTMAHLVKR